MDLSAIVDYVRSADRKFMIVVGTALVGITALYFGSTAIYVEYRKLRFRKKKYPRDTVIMFQDARAPCAPSLSPWCLKLETFLRMAKIPYLVNQELILSSQGKIPWIEYNGQAINDSQFAIEFLKKKLGVDLDRNFTDYQLAQARAFRKLLERELFTLLALDRYVYAKDRPMAKMHLPWLVLLCLRGVVSKSAWHHGIGRHSKEDNWETMRQDFAALADFMGSNKFLLGDTPCETDCTMFAILLQIKVHAPGTPGSRMIIESFPTLNAYIDRMRALVWPDWHDYTTRIGTAKATK